MSSEPTISLTVNEARTLLEILRYTTTANKAVVDASIAMWHRLEDGINRATLPTRR